MLLRKKLAVVLAATLVLALGGGTAAFAAPNPSGTDQPGAECGDPGATVEPAGFSSGGFIGLILLVVFGPKKLPGMARDFGRFLSDARRSVEEFKVDLVSEKEDGRELVEGQHEAEVGEGLEEDVEREEDEVAPQNASRTG